MTVLFAGDNLTSPVTLIAVATAIVAVLVVSILADRLGVSRPVRRSIRPANLRERSRRTASIRQCDPDAAGRPRPPAQVIVPPQRSA